MRRTVCLAVTALTLQVDEKDSPGMQRVLRNRSYASGSIALWCSPTTYAACSAENLVGRRHMPQTVTGTPAPDGAWRKIFSSQLRSGARSNTIRWPASAAHRST